MATNNKILVTGGAGFIGSHTVVELYNAGFEPVIVDDLRNSREGALRGIEKIIGTSVKCHHVDCNDRKAMQRVFQEEAPIGGVIHFAADKAVGESVQDPLKYYHNNIGSLVVLLEVMKANDVNDLVFSSSCTVYGQPDHSPVTEDTAVQQAESPYGATKVFCERVIQDFKEAAPNFKATILRYFNPIGAHPTAEIGELPLGVPNNLVPFITQTAAGIREQLTIFGEDYSTADGTCVRDYIHVVDLAKAHVQAIRFMSDKPAPMAEVFNLGTGQGNSVLEVVKAFEEVAEKPLNHILGPRRPGDVEQIWADPAKANKVLGWHSELSMKEALADAWRWQQKLN